jgi:hypothetical protein
MNPAALAQAQALSNLETGRAGGLSALERYGATGQDFASQMAQVAQQQGTEMNAAILASLQNRLAESLAAEQTGGGGGGGSRGPSLRDQMAFTDWASEQYRRNILGLPSMEEQKFLSGQEQWGYEQNFRLNQAAAQLAQNFLPQNRDATPEEQQQALDLATSILTR